MSDIAELALTSMTRQFPRRENFSSDDSGLNCQMAAAETISDCVNLVVNMNEYGRTFMICCNSERSGTNESIVFIWASVRTPRFKKKSTMIYKVNYATNETLVWLPVFSAIGFKHPTVFSTTFQDILFCYYWVIYPHVNPIRPCPVY